MTRLLVLTDWYEPGYKAGGPVQSCRYLVDALHDEFALSVLTGDRDFHDVTPYPGIPTDQWVVREPGVSVYYAPAASLGLKKLSRLLQAKDADTLYLNSLYSLRFMIYPLLLLFRGKIRAKIVLAPRGMLQAGAMQTKPFKKKLFIRLLRALRLPQRIWFQATDEQEKQDILQWFPAAREVALVANFSATPGHPAASIEKKPGSLRCIYLSRISEKKNLLFLLGLLAAWKGAEIELAIFGEPEEAAYAEKIRQAEDRLPAGCRVVRQGAIPHERVAQELGRHHLFVLPTRGENFGHAIFEAFAAARPVLISDKTPWRALADKNAGWDISLGSPELWLLALETAAGWDQTAFDAHCRSAYRLTADRPATTDLKTAYHQLFD